MQNSSDKIIIVGAGLCGTLLAIRLAQKDYRVTLYERRSDMRLGEVDSGRSINLALSNRGLLALESADLKEAVLKGCIPMRGRKIHPVGGDQFISPYSGRTTDYINSVSRSGLNIILLNEAEKYNNIDIKFQSKVLDIDIKEARIKFEDAQGNSHEDKGQIVVGTDGAGSVVRKKMLEHTDELNFDYSQDFLSHGYKELSIKPTDAGGWRIEKEALHIWPRGDFMIIALPNLDGSFTLTMFHPYQSEIGFDNLNSPEKVAAFFEEYYPTLLPYIPHYQEEYAANPVGKLGTIKCNPWHAYGKTLIMGDAAHAIVPFYGQGMNASLEDVRIFDDWLEEFGSDWNAVFDRFQFERLNNTNAIADLAIDNFYEMRDHVDDEAFMRKRKIEMQLEKEFKDYYSKYSMVTFRPNMSYNEAKVIGRKQDEILLEMCERSDYDKIPLEEYYKKLKGIIF